MSRANNRLHTGLSIAKSDGGWLASYQNSVGKVQEISIFADETMAKRAGSLWLQGFRFDVIRAEYEAMATLQDLAAKYVCHTAIVRECIVIGGGTIRSGALCAANRKGQKFASPKRQKMTGAKLVAAQKRMAAVRAVRYTAPRKERSHG